MHRCTLYLFVTSWVVQRAVLFFVFTVLPKSLALFRLSFLATSRSAPAFKCSTATFRCVLNQSNCVAYFSFPFFSFGYRVHDNHTMWRPFLCRPSFCHPVEQTKTNQNKIKPKTKRKEERGNMLLDSFCRGTFLLHLVEILCVCVCVFVSLQLPLLFHTVGLGK